jgi:predicted O-methyltransferase YrrM
MKPRSITSLLMVSAAAMAGMGPGFEPPDRYVEPYERQQRDRDARAHALESERAAKHAKLQEVKRQRREAKEKACALPPCADLNGAKKALDAGTR